MKGRRIAECAIALLREIENEPVPELRDAFEVMALSTILINLGVAEHIPHWLPLLRRYRLLAQGKVAFLELKRQLERAPETEGLRFYGMLFAMGATGISSVQRLEEIIGGLDG